MLLALYGKSEPDRHRRRLHARRGRARAAVRDAAVRRALRAAGADRARPRRWRRRPSSLGAGPPTVLRRIVLPTLLPAILSGHRAELRPRDRRVRLARPDHRQPAVQDRGRLRLHLRPDRERKPRRGRRRLGRAARRRARGPGVCSASSNAASPAMPASTSGSAVTLPGARSAASRARAPARRSTAAEAARRRDAPDRARVIALGYLALLLLGPLAMIFYRTFEHGLGAGLGRGHHAGRPARASGCRSRSSLIVVPLNTIFGIGIALLLERGRFRGQDRCSGCSSTCRSRSRRSSSASSLVLVYGQNRLVRRLARRTRHPDHLLGARHGDGDGVRVAAVRRARDDARCCARSAPTPSRPPRRSARARGRRSGGSPCPGIRWGVVYGVVLTTARALGEFGAVSIVSGTDRGPDADAAALRPGPLRELRHAPAPTRPRSCSRCWRSSTLLAMNLLTRRADKKEAD